MKTSPERLSRFKTAERESEQFLMYRITAFNYILLTVWCLFTMTRWPLRTSLFMSVVIQIAVLLAETSTTDPSQPY